MTWTSSPILGCSDVRATAEWFRDALGYHLDPDEGLFGYGDEGAVYAIVERAGHSIHLQIRRGERPAAREDIETDAYVYVDDADALHAEFTARAVPLHRDICDNDYGLRDFCVRSPEGHRIAFGSGI